AQGVKANVLFFDRKPGREKPWTSKVWVYDFRTNVHMTLKTKRLTREDLDEFVECYKPGARHERKATGASGIRVGSRSADGVELEPSAVEHDCVAETATVAEAAGQL